MAVGIADIALVDMTNRFVPALSPQALQSKKSSQLVGYPAGSQLRLRSIRDTGRLSEVETGCTGCLFAWKFLSLEHFTPD
jgi:hypothetical protein